VLLGVASLAVGDGHVPAAERSVFGWLNDWPDAIYRPAWVVMQLGNVVAVPVAVLGFIVLRRYRLAFGCAVAGTAAYFLADVVKDAVDRGRPAAVLDSVHLRGAAPSGLGFVSGPAAVAVALGTVASLWGPALGAACGAGARLIVGAGPHGLRRTRSQQAEVHATAVAQPANTSDGK
jgi:hypothetical protein